jgi:nitrite reductase (NADH) small subunit
MPGRKHDICGVDEVPAGSKRAIKIGATPAVLVRHEDGTFYALRDSCAHMGARLSEGRFQPRMESDGNGCYEVSSTDWVVRCPWHGFEFDIKSGRCLGDPAGFGVRTYTVSVEDGRVVVER